MLPGITPIVGRKAVNIAYRTSASSSTNQITIPATAKVGDLAVLFSTSENGASIPTNVNPTGWTEISSATNASDQRGRISAKIIVAADIGATITEMNGTNQNDKLMLVFSGFMLGFTAADIESELTFGNPTAQSVTATGGTKPLIVLGLSFDSAGTGAFSTASPAFDATVAGADADILVGYKIYNRSGTLANHSVDMNDLSNHNWLASLYIQCR